MNIYKGTQAGSDGYNVTVNGAELALRLDIANHSPTGFAWGYAGSGPAQLALAILANEYGSLDRAPCHYQDFKQFVVAGLPDQWAFTSHTIRYLAQCIHEKSLVEQACTCSSCRPSATGDDRYFDGFEHGVKGSGWLSNRYMDWNNGFKAGKALRERLAMWFAPAAAVGQ